MRVRVIFVMSLLIAVLAGCGGNASAIPSGVAQPPGGSSKVQIVQKNPPSRFVTLAIPTAHSVPAGIAVAPDGTIWFTESSGNKIAKIDNTGTITEYSVPTSASAPQGITVDPSTGDVWFAEKQASKIGHWHAGAITEYSIPTSNVGPYGITEGPDGNLWFTEYNSGNVGRVATSGGSFVEYSTNNSTARPTTILTGPDGALWFAESNNSAIGRVTTTGSVANFTVASNPQDIALASDGDFWFTMPSTNSVGVLTTKGRTSAFPAPTGATPWGVTKGPGGNPWFTEVGANALQSLKASLTSPAFVAVYTIPTASANPTAIVTGADGNLWFTEQSTNKIGVCLYHHQTATPSSIGFTALGQTQTFSVSETNYSGTFYANSSNGAVATVSPSSGATTFTVQAIAAGTATITVSDNSNYPTSGNGTTISVTVTTTSIIIQ